MVMSLLFIRISHLSFSLPLFLQMLGCKSRGFSFTRALLGISADELHLCGDPAAVPLIQEILKVTGDDVQVRKLLLTFCSPFLVLKSLGLSIFEVYL